MKKWAFLLWLFIAGLLPTGLATDYCEAVAKPCGEIAWAPVPPGGTCVVIEDGFTAAVIVYDAAGAVVASDFVRCRLSSAIDPC